MMASNRNRAQNNNSAQSTGADFSCSGRSLVTLTNMLKALHCGKKTESQLTSVCVDHGGMAWTTSKAKCMTARCYLRTEYFSSFALNDEFQIEFTIDISTLIQVFLTQNDLGSITDCQLYTFDTADNAVDLQWSQYRVVNQLSAKSQYFRDIFSEIDALARNEALVWFQIDKVQRDEDEQKEMMMIDGVNGSGINQDAANGDNEDANEQHHGDGRRGTRKRSSITIGVTSDTLCFEGTVPMTWDICENWTFEKSAKYQYRLSLLRPAIRAIAKSMIIRIHFNEMNAVQIAHVFDSPNSDNNAQSHPGWNEYIILPQDTDFVDNDSDDE